MIDVVTAAHHVVWVQWNEDTTHTIECSCGEKWRRDRLADAVVALERHQTVKANLGRNALNNKEASNG